MSKFINYEMVEKQYNNALEICHDCVFEGQYCVGCDIHYDKRRYISLMAAIEEGERVFEYEQKRKQV